jgi:hypothetical protein
MSERRVYVRYSHNRIAREYEVTVAGAKTPIVVDMDAAGEIVGVELLDAVDVTVDGGP